jgi:hypothetical protein
LENEDDNREIMGRLLELKGLMDTVKRSRIEAMKKDELNETMNSETKNNGAPSNESLNDGALSNELPNETEEA